MKKDHYIMAAEFCYGHNIEFSLLHSLHDNGLINLERSEESIYIDEVQLPVLEKMVSLYDLGINVEGIEIIISLLDQRSRLQEEIELLRNRLRFYEYY